MQILITGATGLVGQELVPLLLSKNYGINILTRNASKARERFPASKLLNFFDWDYKTQDIPKASLENVEAVIHLMGENIAEGRWSDEQKKEILSSRIEPLKNLAKILKENPEFKLKTLISTSAVGIYGNSGAARLDEKSDTSRDGFLPMICQQWESAAQSLHQHINKIAILRVGVVMAQKGGALKKILPPFKLGAGGKLGSGEQYMSWIHVNDLTRLYMEALENPAYQGIINAVAPQALSNIEFTKTLSEVLHRPAFFSVPGLALKVLLGEMSQVLLEGQNVYPGVALSHNFKFNFDNLKKALKNLV